MLESGAVSQPLLYPTLYRWFIVAATLDVLCTYTILMLGGAEVNIIADRVIQAAGLPGMVAYKFAGVALVLVICEYTGRRRAHVGRRLAIAAITISCLPVVAAFSQLYIALNR